jgi:hypothetical protein
MKKPTQSFLCVLLLLGGFSVPYNTTQAMLSPVDGLEAPKSFGRLYAWLFGKETHQDTAVHDDRNDDEPFIEAGAPLDARDEYGQTALHRAAMRFKIDVVEQLLNAGVPVDIKDARGQTALHHAVMEKCFGTEEERFSLVKLLLCHGANPTLQDMDGKTVLHHIYTPGQVAFDQDDGIKKILGGYKQNTPDFYRMIEKPLSKPSFFETFAEIRRTRNATQWLNLATLLIANMLAWKDSKQEAIRPVFPVRIINPLDLQDRAGNTVLKLALRHNDADMVHLLVSIGAHN